MTPKKGADGRAVVLVFLALCAALAVASVLVTLSGRWTAPIDSEQR
jgi:hypothetical protein